MVANQNKYTPEFKRETADYIIAAVAEGRSIKGCCEELGLNKRPHRGKVGGRPAPRAGRRAGPGGGRARAQGGAEAHPRARDGERLPEKSRGLLRQHQPVAARYRLMLEERAESPVKMMARLLGVSRSGFYSWLSRGAPEDEWAAERAEVERVWRESDGRFGRRMVRAMMPPEMARITLYRVLVLMRELGIRGCTPNARKRTTVPGSGADGRPDLIGRDFESPVPTCKLVGDIT